MLATFGVGQVLESMLWLVVFVVWLMLLFHVLVDVFRSPDLGGVAKTLWLVFVIVLPFLGVLSYVVVRGGKMHDHDIKAASDADAALRDYVRKATGSPVSAADEITRLASLREQHVIDDTEFQKLKLKVVG